VKNGVTWYGILGVLPGASPDQIQQHYEAKAAVVRPELVAGSPSKVVAAVTQAQALLDDARRVLSDREARQRYDEGDRRPSQRRRTGTHRDAGHGGGMGSAGF
jgi:curved DNA-binding protein CbpA